SGSTSRCSRHRPRRTPENTCGTTSPAARRTSSPWPTAMWWDGATSPCGRALMQATLTAAKASGMRRIELTVRVDNEPAKRLYESFGFVTEGLCKRHMCIDGQFVDSWLMALLP